jgi:Pentapeptide repeats (9 copies)
MFVDNKRTIETDKRINEDIACQAFSSYLFTRLGAKARYFKKVDFRYSIFDRCYLRKCVFDSCDFTGAQFINSNFLESSFIGCKFDYCSFEKTTIESEILDNCCPPFENLKLRFARSLRINYQQLGDTDSANKAIKVELKATELRLHKSWRSNESYYRLKYAGWRRVRAYLDWFQFKMLDFIWGNGESATKLIRTVLIFIIAVAVIDFSFWEQHKGEDLLTALLSAPAIFLGTLSPDRYSKSWLAVVTFFRLTSLALFMSIIIKRFNRR